MVAIILGIFRYVLGFYFQNDGGNDFTALYQDFITKKKNYKYVYIKLIHIYLTNVNSNILRKLIRRIVTHS